MLALRREVDSFQGGRTGESKNHEPQHEPLQKEGTQPTNARHTENKVEREKEASQNVL